MTTINGHQMTTTFWEDFTIADAFGEDAVVDTFNRVFNEWKSDVVYLAELTIVTNHKGWQHYQVGDEEIAQLYFGYYHQCMDYAYSGAFDEDDVHTFFRITD